jgi:hypothetical protein
MEPGTAKDVRDLALLALGWAVAQVALAAFGSPLPLPLALAGLGGVLLGGAVQAGFRRRARSRRHG